MADEYTKYFRIINLSQPITIVLGTRFLPNRSHRRINLENLEPQEAMELYEAGFRYVGMTEEGVDHHYGRMAKFSKLQKPALLELAEHFHLTPKSNTTAADLKKQLHPFVVDKLSSLIRSRQDEQDVVYLASLMPEELQATAEQRLRELDA